MPGFVIFVAVNDAYSHVAEVGPYSSAVTCAPYPGLYTLFRGQCQPFLYGLGAMLFYGFTEGAVRAAEPTALRRYIAAGQERSQRSIEYNTGIAEQSCLPAFVPAGKQYTKLCAAYTSGTTKYALQGIKGSAVVP